MTKRDVAALFVLLACTTICVAGKFRNEFVFDDVYVVGGALIHEPSRIGEAFAAHTLIAHSDDLSTMPMDTYRPLALVSFFWDAWLSGRETWSYHLTNLLLHLAVVASLFALARRLLAGAPVWVAAAATSFFALSPQLAEAHVWINGRSDPLATLFGLLALLVWRGPEASARRQLGAGGLFFAGLLCKETLLFGLPSLLWWPPCMARPWRERLRALLGFAFAALFYLALRSWALSGLHAAGGSTQLTRALQNLPVLWLDGLSELLAPTRVYLRSLRDEYALLGASERLLIGLTVAACAGLTLAAGARMRVLRWGLVWFASTLAPAALISTLLWPGFGRFLYMPCIGLALGLGELLARADAWLALRFADTPARARRVRALGAFCLASYLLALGLLLTAASEHYENDKRLYLSAAQLAPRPAYAFAAYGASRAKAGDAAGAIAPLAKAAELDPGEPAYVYDLAENLMRAGNPLRAAELLRAGIARAPAEQAGDLRILLVQVLAGYDPRAAIAVLCDCLHFQPEHVECLRAPRWLLDPRAARAAEFQAEFASFPQRCGSARARGAMARVLAGR